MGRGKGHGPALVYYKSPESRYGGKGGIFTLFLSPSFPSLILEDPSKAVERAY